ncbi:MAG: PA14 domain-containing protein [Armatimonadetes bacterium]|nr:PA14 domain-containing protein [Armatimonadota bacterium]
MKPTTRVILFAMVIISLALAANATVAVNSLFGNNMVLQRDKACPIWGSAAASKTITVTLKLTASPYTVVQTKTTTSDAQGNWVLYLDAMAANSTNRTLTINEASANTLTFTNVVVGDVWICSGQSNADFGLSGCNRQTEDVNTANFAGIRHMRVPMVTSRDPLKTLSSSWEVCSPSTAGGFSAIGFYFARKIYQDQSSTIPIGIITSAIGGTVIDIWLAPEGLSDIPVIQPLYTQEIMPWGPFCSFNGMVHPLAPIGAKGMIWYQGENREMTNQSTDSYYLKEKALQNGWKRLFGLDDFALYVVQLANWLDPAAIDSTTPDAWGSWSDTRQMQEMVSRLPHGGMASAIDVGEAADIHPKDKLDVGERLALWALKNDYGRTTIVPSGPILKDVTVSGTKLICSFDYVGSGLMVGYKTSYPAAQNLSLTGGTLQRFLVAGASGSWYTATATIVGNTVEVSSPSVSAPRKVAYAYWMNPAVPVETPTQTKGLLYNIEGLPASPFYIDDATATGHFTVTATAGAGGTISPLGATTYLKRRNPLYTITPDVGKYILDVKIDGTSVGSVKYYTFDPLYANHTIAVTFDTVAPNYTITTTSTASGTISPAGPVSIAQGGSQTFKMVPNTGCRLITVTADGAPLGNRNSVIFADVRTAHSVNATFAVIPTPGTGTGLRGDYYIGTNFETFKVTRTNATINFDWGVGSPNPAIPIEGFTVRWSGQIQPQFTETYKFYVNHDDGAKLWVNNVLVVNNWGAAGTDDNGSIALTAGTKYNIKLEYVEQISNASCKLEWYSTSLPREVVPQTQLFPATTAIYTLTATAGSNGSFSPSGAVLANSGGSQTFSVLPSVGYYVSDVKVDNVSVGAPTSYTFNNVTANHAITATFAALPSYSVSGKVINKTTLAAISGAKVNFYTSASFIGAASYTATTNASGDYTISIPMGTWSINATATNYFNSATQLLTVSNAAATNINFSLADGTRNIPRTSDLLFSVVTDSLPASGNISGWATYQPSGQTLAIIGSPAVESIMGRKWEKNLYTDGDGFRFGGSNSTPIACSGASIVLVTKPTRSADSGNWRSIVDIFYDRLVLGLTNDGGKVCVRRNGSIEFSNNAIPDGQVTVLSMVVQTDGSYSVYANGSSTAILSATATGANSFISLVPGVTGGVGGYGTYVNVGRNNPDGWTTTNGYIGDVFVYKTALTLAERQTIETDLMSKFITGGATNYTINSTAGAGGTLSPSGSVYVNSGASQTFTIAANTGYATSDVTVDGISQGIKTSHTFTNVTAPHSISAAFVLTTKTITASAGANGSISPSGAVVVNYGANQTFNISPNAGYKIASVTVDGSNAGAGGSYTFNNVIVNHTITAAFTPITYTITSSAGANGSVTPSGAVIVNYNANQIFTLSPSAGYGIASMSVDSAPIISGPVTSYTFINVLADHTISATFAKLIGLNNKSALTDAKLVGKVVKVWGKVKSVNAATSFVISGYSYKDKVNNIIVVKDVTVNFNGLAQPSGFAVNKTVVVTGILSASKAIQAQAISVY